MRLFQQVEIYSKLKEENAVIEANEVTKFPECFEGRVKL